MYVQTSLVSMAHQRLQACLVLVALWPGSLRVPAGVTAFMVPVLLQQQGLPDRRACLWRGGRHSTNYRVRSLVMMDAEGEEGGAATLTPPPRHYSNGRWSVYNNSGVRGEPHEPRDPNRALSKKARARREKEYELGTKIQRMVKLQKLRDALRPAPGQERVSDEDWAKAAGETAESLVQALEEGANAKQEMVVSNLNLVDIIVKNYVGTFAYGRFTEKDLTQDATIGLIRAVDKFDPEKGFLFSTYGRWWVRKYLHEAVQNHNRMVRIPNSAAYRIAKVKRIKAELESEFGRAPTKPEIALEAQLTVKQVEDCLDQDSFHIGRLDGYMGHGCGVADPVFKSHLLSDIAHQAPTVDGEMVVQLSMRDDLFSPFMRLLDATERECLVLRYGLHDGVTNSIEQTAAIMDFCDPDDVRIITTQAMTKLRDGCLPEERKRLMSYLSVYEPKSPSYSKGNYDPNKHRRERLASTSTTGAGTGSFSSIAGTSISSGISRGSATREAAADSRSKQGGVDDAPTTGDAAVKGGGGGEARRDRDREYRRVKGDFSKIGKPGWMKARNASSGSSNEAGFTARAGAVPRRFQSKEQERRMWAARFSKMESEHEREFPRQGAGRPATAFNSVRDEKGERQQPEKYEEKRKFWSSWTPGDKDTGEKRKQQQHGRGARFNGGSGGEEKGEERRLWDFSKHGQEELQHELSRYLRKHRLAKKNAEKAAGLKAELAAGAGNTATTRKSSTTAAAARKKRGSNAGSSSIRTRLVNRDTSSAVDQGRGASAERRLELEQRGRKAEEQRERERALRPIPVGNGAGSLVIGDLEPVANSREAAQLEHLSRLLWDGEEEPADFALSYGKKQKKGRSNNSLE